MAERKGKRARRVDTSPPSGRGFSLADALRASGLEVDPSAADPAPPPAADPPAAAAAGDLAGRALWVRKEKKGRAGKTVTLIGGLPDDAACKRVAKRIRKALGCGSGVEDDLVVVQGDLGDRVEAWLRAEGASEVRR